MSTIKVKFISESQDAFKHPDFSKGAIAQSLQIRYGISQIEKVDVPDNDFIITVDIDKDKDSINWESINFPTQTIKDNVLEIIYYTQIKSQINNIRDEMKYLDWNSKFELCRLAEPLITIIENLRDSRYIKNIQSLHISKIVKDLKYTILQKEGRHLCKLKASSSQRDKNQAVREFLNRINNDLTQVDFALNNLITELN